MDSQVLKLIEQQRLVAIIRLNDLSFACRLSQALVEGGVGVQEFTLTNPQATAAIREVRDQLQAFQSGQAVVGAGSVRSVDDAARAIDAGAQFVVTPTLNTSVIEYCVSRSLPIMSGALTPTEILTAWEAGAAIVKVFPVRSLGPNYIKDLLAPLPELKLMPTGGVDVHNAGDYLSAGAHAVGVGGQLVSPRAIESGDWESIRQSARAYMSAVSRPTGARETRA